MSNLTVPSRMTNYIVSPGRFDRDLAWVRVEDFENVLLPRPVVMINGVFDLLHSSHMNLIFTAREKAATLICAMDSDRMVKEKKSKFRPILSWPERYAQMSYMPVDYIVEIDTDEEFKKLVHLVRPNLRVQGDDHAFERNRRTRCKRFFVRGGSMRTSDIIQRCVDSVRAEEREDGQVN